jgi:hypothetical protein
VHNRFSVRYYLNLVLVDEEDRRYFKQQEVEIYRPLTTAGMAGGREGWEGMLPSPAKGAAVSGGGGVNPARAPVSPARDAASAVARPAAPAPSVAAGAPPPPAAAEAEAAPPAPPVEEPQSVSAPAPEAPPVVVPAVTVEKSGDGGDGAAAGA